jgi:plastocyanin
MRHTFTALLVAAACAAVTRAEGPVTGTISGRVILTTRMRGNPLPSTVYQPRAVARRDGHATPEIRNVVVSLKGVRFRGPLVPAHEAITQEGEAFFPRVLAVTQGSTVEFPNGDPVFHNVFSLSSAASFDLGRYPMGRSRSATFSKPGLVKVYCHIHSQMSASIVVLDHPYFTTPDLDGTFVLRNIPPGDYTVAGWHERVGERTVKIAVDPGKTATVDVYLPVEEDDR